MIDLAEWGFAGFTPPQDARGIPARVLCAYSGYHKFVCAEGFGTARLKASGFRKDKKKMADLVRGVTLKTADAVAPEHDADPAMSVGVPTTGDWVMLDWRSSGDSRIREILPRKTALYRAEVSAGAGRRQILAANFDLVFLVMALDENFSLRRLERYAVIARESGARAAVVLTKSDLAENPAEMAAAAKEAAGGMETIVSSAKDGTGFEPLRRLLKPCETFVLLGASGAGKSTILNSLAGSELMATGEVRESDSKGRHTTTKRELFKLPCGALAIDTPGVRELGLAGCTDSGGLEDSFEDVKSLSHLCRFNDCRHGTEPGCAVRAALENGGLSQARFAAYLKLRSETENKAMEERRLPRSERPSHRWRGQAG